MSAPQTPNSPGEWKLIGEVGVDSGQLLITDPCYINSQWKNESNGGKTRIAPVYRHEDGTVLFCALHGTAPAEAALPFGHYEEVVEKYGKTPNQMVAEGIMVEQPEPPPTGEYSYEGCCEATLSDEQAGQLNYALGHAGAGVVFSSGFGDGGYEVWARYVDAGPWGTRVAEVRVVMIDDDDLDDET
jgi:hypothetical protein